jgi:hypothetical protein
LHGSRFGTGWIATGRPPRCKAIAALVRQQSVGTHLTSFDAQQTFTAGANACPSAETTTVSTLLGNKENSPKAVQVGGRQAAVNGTVEQKCIVQACGEVHQLRYCKKFSRLPPEERYDLVERHKL